MTTPANPDRYAASRAFHERALRVLAGGVSSEFRKAADSHPLCYVRGEGARIIDADGNSYLDFTLSQGPLILGHSHPQVLASVAAATQQAQLVAGQHPAEIELAETLQRLIPCAELLRFSLSGSEADHAAMRLARAHTGRPRILRFEGQYHGWFDGVAYGMTGPNLAALGSREAPIPHPWSAGLAPGTDQGVITLPWNDLDLVERTLAMRGSEIAAIITEPVMCNQGCIEAAPGFLAGLRALCDRFGSVLIFDEVITGFRLGLGGAQARLGITPDLGVFGKALASGWPISVLAGKRAFMRHLVEGTVIHAGTMNAGNPSIAAAQATLAVLARDDVPARLERLGQRLMGGLRDAGREAGAPLHVQGPGPMFHVCFRTDAAEAGVFPAFRDYRDTFACDKPRYARFLRRMQDRGIRLIGRGLWYISAAHTEADIDQCIATARQALAEDR